MDEYDLFVIGTGLAGQRAAVQAAWLGPIDLDPPPPEQSGAFWLADLEWPEADDDVAG